MQIVSVYVTVEDESNSDLVRAQLVASAEEIAKQIEPKTFQTEDNLGEGNTVTWEIEDA